MKQKIVTTFDAVTMPEGCEQAIRRAMAEKQQGKRPQFFHRLGMALAAFAVLVTVTLGLSPTARAAAESVLRKYIFHEIGMTVWEKEHGRMVHYDTESPAFAQIREGRLYFTGHGENLDITDQVTETEPFCYTYLDDTGIEVALTVGYDGSIENFGVYQFLRHPGGEWFTGAGRNFLNPETGTRYHWVDIVWEKLEIPWPMPK